MPRKQRTQPGTSGGNYPQRTDLAQPVRVPNNLPYGQRKQMEEAQSASPLPQQDPLAQVLSMAQDTNFNPVPLNAPSARPNEPVTAGLASGAGPGPEVLQTSKGLSDTLARLANETQNETIIQMLQRARQLGL